MPQTQNQHPLVSIIVPVYNASQFLGECLDSLIQQTYQNLEILCLNDGSIDDSAEIVREYASKDSRIIYLEHENSGVSFTRNRGIDTAHGKYIMFVDSDDYIALDACDYLVQTALRDDADIVVFGGKTFPSVPWKDRSFALANQVNRGREECISGLFLIAGSKPFMCNKLYSSALLSKAGAHLNEDLSLGEDNAFQFCVFPFARAVSYTNAVLYFYRSRDDSATGMSETDYDTKLKKHLQIVEFIVSKWKEFGCLADFGKVFMEWMTDFLHEDIFNASFNARLDAYSVLNKIINEYFSDAVQDVSTGPLGDQYAFFENIHTSAIEKPLLSFVVTNPFHDIGLIDCLRAIAKQTEQRIECLVQEDADNEALQDFISKDCRFRSFQDASGDQILDMIQTQSVIFATPNCRYESYATAALIEHMRFLTVKQYEAGVKQSRHIEKEDIGLYRCDVIAFEDTEGQIRMGNIYASHGPSPDVRFGILDIYPFEALGADGFSALALTGGNKVYSKAFLGNVLANESEDTLSYALQACVSLQAAREISICKRRIVTYSRTELSTDGSSLKKSIAGIENELNEALASRNLINQSIRDGYDSALAELILTIDESLLEYKTYPFAHAAIQQAANNLATHRGIPTMQKTEDITEFKSLLYDDVNTHFITLTQASLDRLRTIHTECLYDFNQARLAIERRDRNIDQFMKSISFKTGRIVTAPFRMIFYAIKRHR